METKTESLADKKIGIAAQTDIGLKRKTNQDRYAMRCFSDDMILMAIADGLGGELKKCHAKQHYSKDVIDQCICCQD